MKLMLPLTSKMSPLWDITSRYVFGGKEENLEVDYIRYITNSFTKLYFHMILCGCVVNIRRLKYVQC